MDVEQLEKIGQSIQSGLSGSVSGYEIVRGELTVHAKAADIVAVATFLRDATPCQFACIIDITAGRLAEPRTAI